MKYDYSESQVPYIGMPRELLGLMEQLQGELSLWMAEASRVSSASRNVLRFTGQLKERSEATNHALKSVLVAVKK